MVLCVAPALAVGCAVTQKGNYPTVEPDPVYDRLYPYYAEICAVSQIRSNFARRGGTPGHAAMYLRGACKDKSSAYPRIKLCSPDRAESGDPDVGIGISVNKAFSNVNWMSVEGRSMFMDGTLQPGEVLDEERSLQTILAAVKAGVWDGIDIHDKYRPPSDSADEWEVLIAGETISTDFALRFGRHVYCARMPMPRERFGRVIDYLNGLNDQYARGDNEYNWSGYSDNCTHALRNALADADVWKPLTVGATKIRQLFNLAVPANEFANLAIRGNLYPLEDFGKIYGNERLRRVLLEEQWLPTRHGALLAYLPVHQPNELYETEGRIFVLEAPLLRQKSGKISKMFHDPRYTDVLENLRYWKTRYEDIFSKRPDDWDQPPAGDDRAQARKRYYEYMQAQLEDVERMLAGLRTTDAVQQ